MSMIQFVRNILITIIYCSSFSAYAQSGGVIEEAFILPHPSDKDNIHGSIYFPASIGSFPCVILVEDIDLSSNDRMTDESRIQLIQGFLEKNIAVLQYHQYKEQSGANGITVTVAEATIALRPVYNLAISHPSIQHQSVGFLGFGEGALVAAKMAADQPEVGFLCFVNLPTLTKDKTVLLHVYDSLSRSIDHPETIKKYIDLLHVFIEISKRESNESQWNEQINHTIDNHLVWFSAEEKKSLQLDKKKLKSIAHSFYNSNMQYAYTYDPLEDLSMLEQPVLALYPIHNKSSELNAEALEEMVFILDRSQFSIVKDLSTIEGYSKDTNSQSVVLDWVSSILP